MTTAGEPTSVDHMRTALAALLLLFAVGCGSDAKGDAADKQAAAEDARAQASIDAKTDTCNKLVRTWAVAATKLKGDLVLALVEDAKATLDAMTAATEQMDIEDCLTPAEGLALQANYEAAVAYAKVLQCDQMDPLACKASVGWVKKGEPFIAKARSFVE